MNELEKSYPFLEATIVPEVILVHIPFIEENIFKQYKIISFPPLVNNPHAKAVYVIQMFWSQMIILS